MNYSLDSLNTLPYVSSVFSLCSYWSSRVEKVYNGVYTATSEKKQYANLESGAKEITPISKHSHE